MDTSLMNQPLIASVDSVNTSTLKGGEAQMPGLANDASIIKRRKLAHFERDLSGLIQRADALVKVAHETYQPAKVNPQQLRQQMRQIRRWRNGSQLFEEEDEQHFEAFLKGCRMSVISAEVHSLRQELDNTQEPLNDTYDGNCAILREDMDLDIRELEDHVTRVEDDEEVKAMENRIKELKQTMLYLQSELSEVCSSVGSEHDCSLTEPLEPDRLFDFENHPERNRVLSVADKIKSMIKQLKEGSDCGSDSSYSLDAWCSADIDVLRRQLRKMRRWQQNVVHFVADDVQDLELIIGAVEKHINCNSPGSSQLGLARCRRGDSSYGTMRELRMSDVQCDPDESSFTSCDVTSGFSEMHSPDETKTCMDISKEDHSASLGSYSSIDENADFSERLI